MGLFHARPGALLVSEVAPESSDGIYFSDDHQ